MVPSSSPIVGIDGSVLVDGGVDASRALGLCGRLVLLKSVVGGLVLVDEGEPNPTDNNYCMLDIAITLYSLTNTIVIMSSSTCLIMLDQWHLPVGQATSEVRNDTFAWSTDRWNYFVPPYLAVAYQPSCVM